MGKINVYHHALNVGVVDKKHLARVDLERMRLAAEVQTNILPMTTGPAFGRPGLEYISTTDSNDVCRLKEFVFGATDASLMEFTDQLFRVKVDDTLVTRAAVTTAVTTPTFSSAVGWTEANTGGGDCTFGGSGLTLNATNIGGLALVRQEVTCSGGNIGVRHALNINVTRGPVTFRCGSTSGDDDYIAATVLRTGLHSLAFTPTGNFWVQFQSDLDIDKIVASCQVASSGAMTLVAPWAEADLGKLRFAQSADVVFVACDGYQQRRIERRAADSWSIVLYAPDDGPFLLERSGEVKLKIGATGGNTTLTADKPFFKSTHVGALFRLFTPGYDWTFKLGSEDSFTPPIRVTGLYVSGQYSDRQWTYTITGTWVGSIWNQRSFDDPDTGYGRFRNDESEGGAKTARTANVAGADQADQDSNAITYYRLGFETGGYTSGTATINVVYEAGGVHGICRVTSFVSSTQVNVEVLRPFSKQDYTDNWQEGEWSDHQAWPSAVAFAEGRLWWSGEDRLWASVSDDFENFDDETEGDSGPISRSIATGGVNDTQWMLGLQRLLIGTNGAVSTCKSSSLDEPLTPTNLSIKDSSSTGAAPVDPVKVDTRGLFIERSGKALMELTFDGTSGDYVATQLSKLATEIFEAGVKQVAIQRRPDTRIWIVMDDGSCVCVVYEPLEEVLAFIPIETDGDFESVAVLPADDQDRVYFSIARTINSSTVRYIEKMALDTEVAPSTKCKVMDAFKHGTNGPASTTIAAGTHLIGETVVVWADGAPLTEVVDGLTIPLEFVVDGSGNITVASAVTNWVVGLPYTARYRSARLAYGAGGGTAMLQKKRVTGLGLLLTDFVRAGIRYGSEFDNAERPMFPLPALKDGTTADAIVLSEVDDEETFTFPSEFDTDSRVALEWQSPFTCTVLGIVMGVETNG